MQITLDLPDDAFAKVDAIARQESRSLGSVLADLIHCMKPSLRPVSRAPQQMPGHRFPVVEGRPVTQAEIDHMLAEDGLP